MCPMRMERVEAAARVVIEYTEAFNRRDLAAVLQLISDECLFEGPDPAPDGSLYSGKSAITCYLQDQLQGSPQMHVKIEEIFGYGMRCIVRWRMDWTDGSGNQQHVRGIDVTRVQNGVITEKLSYVKG